MRNCYEIGNTANYYKCDADSTMFIKNLNQLRTTITKLSAVQKTVNIENNNVLFWYQNNKIKFFHIQAKL